VRRYLAFILTAFVLLLASVFLWKRYSKPPQTLSDKGGQIHGFLLAQLPDGSEFPIPQLMVTAYQEEHKPAIAEVSTDDNGWFVLPRQKPGLYRVCWSGTGWMSECTRSLIKVSTGTSYAVEIFARPDVTHQDTRIIHGIVTHEDGSPCNLSNQFLGINQQTFVVAKAPSGNVLRKVLANAGGEFAIPELPKGTIDLEAECGESRISTRADESDSLVQFSRLQFKSSPPRSERFVTFANGGKPTQSVRPGSTFELRAVGPIGKDSPTFTWHESPAGPALVKLGNRSAEWQAPLEKGVFSVFVELKDKNGAVSLQSIPVAVGDSSGGAATPTPKPPPSAGFLKRKENDDVAASRYYQISDPLGKRDTLGKWWQVNGFGADGSGGIRSAYLNDNDLGTGRDMHCLVSQNADAACYVTNYGDFLQNPASADLAWGADKNTAIATVAMEYSSIEGISANRKVVKFFVFGGGLPESKRIKAVALIPSSGPQAVPGLCLNCHGGSYQPSVTGGPATLEEVDLGSSFREFDLATFVFPRNTPRSSQEDTFRQLNQMVLKTNPAPAISELISGWYSGSATQNNGFIPPGWIGNEPLYRDVVVRSCRTCHVALDSSSSNSVVSWTSYDQFRGERSAIKSLVCGSLKNMPHAKVTYENFWLRENGGGPRALAQFAGAGWRPIGTCQ
jgi:hypothetical protein